MSDQQDKNEKAAKLLAMIEKYRLMERYWMGVAAGQHEIAFEAETKMNSAIVHRREYAQKIKMKSREYAVLTGAYPPLPPDDLRTGKTAAMQQYESDEARAWMDRTAELDAEYKEIADEDNE